MTAAEDVAGEVARISLLGAPRAVLVDDGSTGAEGTAAGQRVRRLLDALAVDVVTLPLGAVSLASPSVAVLSSHHAPVSGCYAWYVGAGPCPPWMHPTDGQGPATTGRILALLGTGLAQERAGAAFRAAGAGRPAPRSASYDGPAIWSGITGAVGPVTPVGTRAPRSVHLDLRSRRDLLRSSVIALDRCCAANGAIAAAPRGAPDEPDYWFFWQRDAAHTAIALHALARSGPDDEMCTWARARASGYVDFVAALGPMLGRHPAGAAFSRCTMTGAPVDGYGDPQPDGPAATSLAVLSLVAHPRVALDVARPFLDFLAGGGARHPGFDLWELTVGTSFHAVNLARRALRRAAEVAVAARDPAADRYREAAEQHAALLRTFLDPARDQPAHVLDPLPPWFAATSRLDVSVVGSVLFGYDVDDDLLNVDDPHVAATMRLLEEHFAERWPVNAAWRGSGNLGVGVGRFPEDCNDGVGTTGGNPWPVATLWAAQYHARRVERAVHLADSAPSASGLAVAQGYLTFVLAHADPASISEQIDAATGGPRGVRLLTWAHAELVTTLLSLDALPG